MHKKERTGTLKQHVGTTGDEFVDEAFACMRLVFDEEDYIGACLRMREAGFEFDSDLRM